MRIFMTLKKSFIQINVNIRECWTLIFGTFIIIIFGSYISDIASIYNIQI